MSDFTPNPTLRRPPADILATLLALEAAGAPQSDFHAAAKAYRGGRIWPFEYDIVRAIQDLFPLVKQPSGGYDYADPATTDRALITQALQAFDPDHPAYRWPFDPGAKVVNVLPSSDAFTNGRTYTVIQCDDGEAGCGEQTWVRVANDSGRVYGNDPERFMLADEYHAIHAARAGGGRLSKQAVNTWMRPRSGDGEVPPDSPHFDDALITRLKDKGVLISEGFGKVKLVERSRQVKRAGARLLNAEIVALALVEALQFEDPTFELDAEGCITIDQIKAIDLAENLIRELGLEKVL